MAQPAFDIQEVPRTLDMKDSTGPTSRNLQQDFQIVRQAASHLLAISGDQTTAATYTLSEDWKEADRAAYKTAVDAARSALKDASAALATLVKL